MADIVIVPTYDRPEYLWLCLEKLHAAYGVQEKEIWVCEDNHIGGKDGWAQFNMIPVLEEARRLFKHFRYISRKEHRSYGNSYNVLEALRETCWSDAEFIYLVEDDVMVMPDFFDWHMVVHRDALPDVTCAERYNHSLNFAINGQYVLDETFRDPMAYVVAKDVYSSLGVCFAGHVLSQFMHHWGRLGKMHGGWDDFEFEPGREQDILIKQFLRQMGMSVAWPYVPRCYHTGWYGYHRNTGMRFQGTLKEKVDALRAAIIDPAKIREMAGAQDIEACATQPIVWTDEEMYEVKKYR